MSTGSEQQHAGGDGEPTVPGTVGAAGEPSAEALTTGRTPAHDAPPATASPVAAAAPPSAQVLAGTRWDPWEAPPSAGQFASWPPAAPERRPVPGTNGLGIAALVTGLTLLLWPVAIGLGIGSLVQLRKRRQRGRALATAGLFLGLTGLVGTTALFAFVVHEVSRTTYPVDLQVGQCYNRILHSSAVLHVVPCSEPHLGEVAQRVDLTGPSDYPGSTAVEAQADAGCAHAEQVYAMDRWLLPRSVISEYYEPFSDDWKQGKHTAVCILQSTGRPTTGSVRRDSTDLTPDQLAFLQAMATLDQLDHEAPRSEGGDYDEKSYLQQYAGALPSAATLLAGRPWPGGAGEKSTQLITALRAAAPAWRDASNHPATDSAAQLAQLRSAHAWHAQERDLRQALGLATEDLGHH
ncbi:DUF4190 domain-containing protein [Kitasatospora sp. NPDC058965]|uniref:DUF4190 domain-containing protein n=1 Tax=Kitasatospora sp. NPDC058965 TaxID=3346682 RepID=UPI0036BE146F